MAGRAVEGTGEDARCLSEKRARKRRASGCVSVVRVFRREIMDVSSPVAIAGGESAAGAITANLSRVMLSGGCLKTPFVQEKNVRRGIEAGWLGR